MGFFAAQIASKADISSCNSKTHPMWLAAEVSYPAHSFTANNSASNGSALASFTRKVVQNKRIAADFQEIFLI